MSLEFNQLIREAAGLASEQPFKQIRVAILGDSATQFLNKALVAAGKLQGFDCDIFEADHAQIERQVFDAESDLYAFAPDFVLIAFTAKKRKAKFYGLPIEEKSGYAAEFLATAAQLCQSIAQNSKAKVLFCNLEVLDDQVFGSFANQVPASFLYQVRRINVGLMDLAAQQGNVFILDVAALQSRFGKSEAFSANIYVSTDLVHSLNFTAAIAQAASQIISAISGKFKKCLILDLDNTTWGGVIGDDGLEHIELGSLGIGKVFVELQQWAKALKERGIILCICSKNTESVALEPFEKHPDMVLRREDIAVFVANWDNKADNIRYIQRVLNIGFDSMVFLDDNPAERQIVRENLPEVTVPELPEDPAEYLSFLQTLNLFETASFSSTDVGRTKQYQEEASRVAQGQQFTNVDDFLKSLKMKAFVRPFSDFDIPRVAQLTQRSNQFNLRTTRYTEDEIRAIANDPNYVTFAFNLEDKFGDNGLIAVVILQKTADKKLFIDTWLMSCRVLKRGMEAFTLETLVEAAKAQNCEGLLGEFIPTAKNAMVAEHYSGLGFVPESGLWYLASQDFTAPKHFIQPITKD